VLDFEQHFITIVLPTLRNKPRFLQVEEIAADLTLLQIDDASSAPERHRHKKDPTHNAG